MGRWCENREELKKCLTAWVILWKHLSRCPDQIRTAPEQTIQCLYRSQSKKADQALKIVTGIVLEPFGGAEAEPDTQGDYVSAREIETAAHAWLAKSRVIGLEHAQAADGAQPVESYLVPYPTVQDYKSAMNGDPHNAYKMAMGEGQVVSGSWVVSTKLDDLLWEAYKSGDLSAYSMGGLGARQNHRGKLPLIGFIGVGDG